MLIFGNVIEAYRVLRFSTIPSEEIVFEDVWAMSLTEIFDRQKWEYNSIGGTEFRTDSTRNRSDSWPMCIEVGEVRDVSWRDR